MDDADYVCPLCCEELDLSDREFYPCKCGYQVCMWCWHRIRETESGLCPACRTPYGEDPHQFSAVDVEEVLKANKEKEAAAKRQRQQQQTEDGVDAMAVPQDRTQLANMRVIRRNLVYAVGLPPHIATEENLRKPDFFGQYGKISKIVINRSQANVADARRASASAYVTFVYKEDTLSCILALDGFYLDNRNIRASYGTSKYCSAFIKNVRCNNPDCTYLHEMGAAEDTFTKQEIQAGYVTSGRDVLARQQQIVAEQLRQAGSSGGEPRKRTGGGGPSGTGKAASSPVFPPPEFDEPTKPAPTLVPPPPPPSAIATRTSSVPSGVPTVAAVAAKHVRSASIGAASTSSKSPTLSSIVAPGSAKNPSIPVVSAASVVAGTRPVAKPDPEPHTTLTPLTPLKRNKATSKSVGELDKLRGAAAGTKKKQGVAVQPAPQPGAPPPAESVPAPPQAAGSLLSGPGTIGGEIIGPPLPARKSGISSLGGGPVGPGSLGGRPLDAPLAAPGSILGGEVFNGPLEKKPMVIGSGNDKWNNGQTAPGMWGHGSGAPGPAPIGGQQLGGNSTSALASLLGIHLPTGSGSLRDTPNLWEESPAPIAAPSPLASLNGSSMPVNGGESLVNGSSLIGGIPIGGGGGPPSNNRMAAPGAIGGGAPGAGGGKSDIALLQSLLPGVHITSGNDAYGGFGWNNGPGGLNGDAIKHWNAGGGSSTSVGTIGRNNQQQNGQGIW
uniref:RING-type domain-containing protein n=1 Tax=Amphora coffeiformis TaxID=265554 RepID=A0A7S3L167_9STRA